jgi:hypothetical protein
LATRPSNPSGSIVVLHVVVDFDAVTATTHQRDMKRGLPVDKSFGSQIVPVQLDDVEGAQEHPLVVAPVPNQVEDGNAVRPAGDRFAIDDASLCLQAGYRLDNAGKRVVRSLPGRL